MPGHIWLPARFLRNVLQDVDIHLGLRDRVEAGLVGRPEIGVAAQHVGRPAHRRAPVHLSRVIGLVLRPEQQLADSRVRTIGPHHQVVAAGCAIGECHIDAVVILRQCFDAQAEPHRHLLRGKLLGQNAVHRVAHDTDGGRITRTQQARQLDRAGDVAVGVAGLELRIAEAALDAAVEQTDGPQRTQRGSLQRDAGARLRPFRTDFHDLAIDPGALEPGAQGHAGHPAAHDQNAFCCAHAPLRLRRRGRLLNAAVSLYSI